MRMRSVGLKAVRPATRLLRLMNFRFGAPKLTGVMYREVLHLARPGDLIVTRTAMRPTNWFIPGHFGHVQILVGDVDGSTIEATWPAVRRSTLVDVWANASELLLVRPTFSTFKTGMIAVQEAYKFIGLPYDAAFELTDRAFYCSELAVRAYELAGATVPRDLVMTGQGRLRAVVPSTLAERGIGEILFDSRKWDGAP